MAPPFFRVPGQATQHRMRLSVDGYTKKPGVARFFMRQKQSSNHPRRAHQRGQRFRDLVGADRRKIGNGDRTLR